MKTKIIFFVISFIIISFLSRSAFSQTGWQQVTSPQSGYELYGIYFKDGNTGVCSKFKTTNGGMNWFQTDPGGSYAMNFIDQNTGYRVGGGILMTTNLGENWITQTNPTGTLYGVHFPNTNTGYACGESGKIIKTTSGGTNWFLLTSPVSTSYYLNGTFFVDANTGFVTGFTTSGNPSVIIKSTNGGSNWDIQSFPTGTGYGAVYFLNAMTGIVIGIKAAKTTDGGATWIAKNLPVSGFLYSLNFSSSTVGYAVGFGGTIIKTTDTGETWFRQTSPSSTLRSVYFVNDNTGYACGNNGIVIKTTDGGGPPFGITPLNNEVPRNYALYQNYPNPFNPVTKINFELPNTDYIKLIVYDVLGKKVALLVNEKLTPGKYEVNFDGSCYPSGVYFYTLTTDSYMAIKKMILIK
jgi:photosystem II stability/assembly factor-like uncharacterized protein